MLQAFGQLVAGTGAGGPPAASPLVPVGTASAGAGGMAPALPALPSLQQRSLGRLLTPEWARLLSLNAADWAALLEQAQGSDPGTAATAGDAPAVVPLPDAAAQQAAPSPKAGAVGAGSHVQPEQAAAPKGRKRMLTPASSGLQPMDGVETP